MQLARGESRKSKKKKTPGPTALPSKVREKIAKVPAIPEFTRFLSITTNNNSNNDNPLLCFLLSPCRPPQNPLHRLHDILDRQSHRATFCRHISRITFRTNTGQGPWKKKLLQRCSHTDFGLFDSRTHEHCTCLCDIEVQWQYPFLIHCSSLYLCNNQKNSISKISYLESG